MIYTAIMGHGIVGSGVAEILINHAPLINEKSNEKSELKYILDLRDFEALSYSDKFIKDFDLILNDKDVKIVIEVMGGLNPAYDYVKKCLMAGKSVVTSNKELVAAKGAELLDIAFKNNANFLFEASVGGAIPILRPLAQCLAANDILEITGILNGTTNYILNKMVREHTDFDAALKLAQENGFAEKNPAADIEGLDAARKIAILASLAFGKHVYPDDVVTNGIAEIEMSDIVNADKFDCVIKLLGRTKRLKNGKICASVKPTLIDKDHILASVNGVFNAIMVKGDASGDIMFYGKGAGKLPTASAVVADVIDCMKHLKARKYLYWQDSESGYVIENNEPVRYYVSAVSDDFDALKKNFGRIFPDNTWNLINSERKEIAFITEKNTKENLLSKINSLSAQNIKIMDTLF